jgi:glycosyltransferase involved in cell wall biosynthesis
MIYINARFLTQEITGVQRFAEMISLELCQRHNDIIFVCPKGILRESVAKKLHVKQFGFCQGHLWEQVELPIYLKKIGSPLLLNLGSTGPIFYKNKIITHHDITYLRYPKSYSIAFLIFYKNLIPMMIRTSRHLLTVSEFSKKEITSTYQYPQHKTSVIYNAVEGKFKPKPQGLTNIYFLAVASINFHKNHHGMIEAFQTFKKKSPGNRKVKLKIIGDSFKAFSYKNHDTTAEMVDIEFLGRVDDEELIRLYQNAYAFIFPSFYEGFGIPPLEAQACGCPVLASDRASIPEILGNSALYFNPFNVNEMIQAMEDIMQESELRLQLIRKGYENIKRFSWELSAEKMIQVVRNIG